jgi:rod shape-determining protein MreC
MKRIRYRPYFFLGLFLLLTLSCPPSAAARLRSVMVSSLAPGWQGLHGLKSSFCSLAAKVGEPEEKGQQFLAQQMESEMEAIRAWIASEERLDKQLDRLKHAAPKEELDLFWRAFLARRNAHHSLALRMRYGSLPGRVVFREPQSWNSAIWIDVGEADNQALGHQIVAVNSPVLKDGSIVGVVEHVGRRLSRARLLTDSRLQPSVRALRGQRQNGLLYDKVEELEMQLNLRGDLFKTTDAAQEVAKALFSLKQVLSKSAPDRYLAKGELHGNSLPLWRGKGQVLQGVGFNYDFDDEEGGARDLRTGQPLHGESHVRVEPLIQVGDLLVTTGLDGVFPPGFPVAVVSSVSSLREGACSYELEAKATAGNLDEIDQVMILPPLVEERIKK